ncbi:MAG: hypothetical protein NVSMB9_31420 [Isosphaeraceae bacterium]
MVPDYYAMLGVPPGADRATIEEALARSQPAWSSGTRNPKTKHTFQSYLDQIPALRQALLGDPTSRAAYDAELAAIRRREHDARLDALQQRIRLRAARGGLTVSDRQVLRDEALKLNLPAEDLDRLVETIPPLPESPSKENEVDPAVTGEALDPVMRRQIRVALDHLRRRDLYEALGVPRDTSAAEIAARADAERQRWMKKSQVTAEKTAWLEVVTLAQSHLLHPASRARYDRSLSLEAEEVLDDSIRFALQGRSRLVPGTRRVLLVEATALGIVPARADGLIARVCRALGVAPETGISAPGMAASPNDSRRWLRCRSCPGVTEFDQASQALARAVCRHCGASLQWHCPICKRSHWVDRPRCPCGFRIELLEPVLRHVEAGRQAFRLRDYATALAHMKRIQELAPTHSGARRGVAMIKEKVTAIDRARSAFEVARAGDRLVEAKAAATAWGRLVDPASPDWRAAYTEVTRRLRDAQALVARARTLEASHTSKARELYRRSLALAADLPEALAGLERCPPDPPTDLLVEFVDDRVMLRWSPPPPDGLGPVSYVVLRKLDAGLTHPNDGLPIGEPTAPTFEDSDVTPGTSVAYGVLSKRGDLRSVAAVAIGPIFLLGEVRGVRFETRSHEVDLSWAPPRGAAEVRVVRKRGSPPSGPQDGVRVEALANEAHDRELETDRVYHYGIYAVYRTPDGRSTASRGVIVSVQPHTPIPALEAPSITPEADGRLRLRWVEPSRGIVKIVRTLRPISYPPGTRLVPIQAASLEGEWIEVTAPDEAHDSPPASGICYYTPLIAWGGMATVGQSAAYSRVSDPCDLRASRGGGGQVHLRWRWGPLGTQSLVVYKQGSYPKGVDDPDARVETVHEADYARLGRYTLTLPTEESGPWYLVVHSLAVVDDQPVPSLGIEPTARTVVSGANPEVIVSYAFRRVRLTLRRWSLTFQTEPPGSPIPPTVLVTHPRTVPLSADDGTIIADFPAAHDGANFPIPSGINPTRPRARVFPDPRVEPNGFPAFRLQHPDSDATRI